MGFFSKLKDRLFKNNKPTSESKPVVEDLKITENEQDFDQHVDQNIVEKQLNQVANEPTNEIESLTKAQKKQIKLEQKAQKARLKELAKENKLNKYCLLYTSDAADEHRDV